jgi:hypothetical protein
MQSSSEIISGGYTHGSVSNPEKQQQQIRTCAQRGLCPARLEVLNWRAILSHAHNVHFFDLAQRQQRQRRKEPSDDLPLDGGQIEADFSAVTMPQLARCVAVSSTR